MKKRYVLAAICAAALASTAQSAAAAVMDFTDLVSGATTFEQNGITVTSPYLSAANTFDPIAGIGLSVDQFVNTIFTFGTGPFDLSSVDYFFSPNAYGPAVWEGFLDGILVASSTHVAVGTYYFDGTWDAVDTVRVTSADLSFTLDNLTVEAVLPPPPPQPATPAVMDFTGLVSGATTFEQNGITVTGPYLSAANTFDPIAGIGLSVDQLLNAIFTFGTGPFDLSSVDYFFSPNAYGPAVWEGFLDGILVASSTHVAVGTYYFGSTWDAVDTVRVTSADLSFTLDNLTIGAVPLDIPGNDVPEPASLVLLSLSLVGLGLARRR